MAKLTKGNYNLITFLISKFTSTLGNSIYSFGMSLYILSLTGSATNFAINYICNFIPRIFLAPFVGYIVDRFSKKKIVILSQLSSTLIVSSALLLNIQELLSLYVIYILTILLSITSLFNSVAFTASIRNLVNDKQLQKAISLNETTRTLGSVLGPIIGGMLFVSVGLNIFLTIFMICFIVALILESTMNFKLNTTMKPEEKIKKNIITETKEGFEYFKKNRLLVKLISINLAVSVSFTAIHVGMPFLFVKMLQLSSIKYGFIQSAFSIGIVLSTLFLSFKKEIKYPFIIGKKAIIALAVLYSLMVVPLFITFTDLILIIYSVIWSILLGITIVFMNTPMSVYFHKMIEEEFRGRVLGIFETLSVSLVPLGVFIYGLLFDYFDAKIIMLVNSGLLLIFVIYYLNKKNLMQLHPDYFHNKKSANHQQQPL